MGAATVIRGRIRSAHVRTVRRIGLRTSKTRWHAGSPIFPPYQTQRGVPCAD